MARRLRIIWPDRAISVCGQDLNDGSVMQSLLLSGTFLTSPDFQGGDAASIASSNAGGTAASAAAAGGGDGEFAGLLNLVTAVAAAPKPGRDIRLPGPQNTTQPAMAQVPDTPVSAILSEYTQTPLTDGPATPPAVISATPPAGPHAATAAEVVQDAGTATDIHVGTAGSTDASEPRADMAAGTWPSIAAAPTMRSAAAASPQTGHTDHAGTADTGPAAATGLVPSPTLPPATIQASPAAQAQPQAGEQPAAEVLAGSAKADPAVAATPRPESTSPAGADHAVATVAPPVSKAAALLPPETGQTVPAPADAGAANRSAASTHSATHPGTAAAVPPSHETPLRPAATTHTPAPVAATADAAKTIAQAAPPAPPGAPVPGQTSAEGPAGTPVSSLPQGLTGAPAGPLNTDKQAENVKSVTPAKSAAAWSDPAVSKTIPQASSQPAPSLSDPVGTPEVAEPATQPASGAQAQTPVAPAADRAAKANTATGVNAETAALPAQRQAVTQGAEPDSVKTAMPFAAASAAQAPAPQSATAQTGQMPPERQSVAQHTPAPSAPAQAQPSSISGQAANPAFAPQQPVSPAAQQPPSAPASGATDAVQLAHSASQTATQTAALPSAAPGAQLAQRNQANQTANATQNATATGKTASASPGASAANASAPTSSPADIRPAELVSPQINTPAASALPPVETASQPALAGDLAAQTSFDGELSMTRSAGSSGETRSQAEMPRLTAQSAQQLAAQITRRFNNGNRVFDIRLDPAELGRVDVRLEMTGDNRVQALLTAERPETLIELQRAARELERMLNEAGLDLDQDGLNFQLSDNADQGEFGSDADDAIPVFEQAETLTLETETGEDAGTRTEYGFRLAASRDRIDVLI